MITSYFIIKYKKSGVRGEYNVIVYVRLFHSIDICEIMGGSM